MAVFIDLEWTGPVVLDGIPQPVERSDTGIPTPREHQLRRAAHADHLVEQHIRRQANQREITPTLADDLVAGGERNEVGEPFHGHAVAVMDQGLDRFWKRQYLCHGARTCVLRTIHLMPNNCTGPREGLSTRAIEPGEAA
jgi:hypothetical protein